MSAYSSAHLCKYLCSHSRSKSCTNYSFLSTRLLKFFAPPPSGTSPIDKICRAIYFSRSQSRLFVSPKACSYSMNYITKKILSTSDSARCNAGDSYTPNTEKHQIVRRTPVMVRTVVNDEHCGGALCR